MFEISPLLRVNVMERGGATELSGEAFLFLQNAPNPFSEL